MDEKDVVFEYLPTDDIPAGIMMKALPCSKHEKFTALQGLSLAYRCEGKCWNLHRIIGTLVCELASDKCPHVHLSVQCGVDKRSISIVLLTPHPLVDNI